MPHLPRQMFGIVPVALLSLLGCSEEEKQRPASVPPPRPAENAAEDVNAQLPAVLFLGDSLTAGLGLPESEAFPALIEKKLETLGSKWQVINAGRSGDTTAGALARLDWYLKEKVNPEVMVIFLGSNDAMRGVPLSTVEENLRAIIKKGRAFRPSLRIFLAELRTFPNMGAEYGQRFQQIFVRVAQEEKVQLIEFPLLEVAGRPELNQPDGVHPNTKGTEKVAETFWKALAADLTKSK